MDLRAVHDPLVRLKNGFDVAQELPLKGGTSNDDAAKQDTSEGANSS